MTTLAVVAKNIYVAWKEDFTFHLIEGDIRNNKWFFQIGIHRKRFRMKLLRYRLKRLCGLKRHG